MKRCVLVLLLAPLLGLAGEPIRYESSVDAMGSTYSVAAYGEDKLQLESAVEASLEEARRLDRMLSNYRAESEWSAVNRNAAERDFQVSPELFNLLAACYEYSRQSEGSFDITVGPLMKVWGFYKGSGNLPHRSEVRSALGKIGYQNLILNPQNRTVHFARPGMEIDPGGIGKGYAVDRMADILKSSGIKSALITAGGSSIYAIGTPPGEKGWKIEIRDPLHADRRAAEVLLRDQSMSTSGNYEKYFRAQGKIYSHIMDPRTGFPAEGMYSVSVITPRTIDSEAWAKPFYILGRQWASQHSPKGFRVFLCEDHGEAKCAWLQ
jgi:thiamine biosynthesis lipoprotein